MKAMKKTIYLFFSLLVLLSIAGCRSQKPTPPTPVVPDAEEPAWTNVTMPVRVTITEPLAFSLNGTATMVRGEYVLVSFRTFGFEVGAVCLTPDEMNLVMKMPQKLWMREPLGDRLGKRGLSFIALQEAMLGNRAVFQSLPRSIDATIGGTETAPEVMLKATVKGKKIQVGITWDLDAAKWNQPRPATFATPGPGYKQLTLDSALKVLGR